MKYPDTKCDYSGEMGANHTEPIIIGETTHKAYLSDEAWNKMMQLGSRLRCGDEGAEEELGEFWSKIQTSIMERISS